jgi:hypothetical protein
MVSQNATLASSEPWRSRWPIWLGSSLAALLLLLLVLWNTRQPQVAGPAPAPARKVSTALPPLPALVAPPEASAPLPARSTVPALHAPRRHHQASHAAGAEPPVAEAEQPAPLPEKPKTDCAVPFTVDEQGVRIPRRECL